MFCSDVVTSILIGIKIQEGDTCTSNFCHLKYVKKYGR